MDRDERTLLDAEGRGAPEASTAVDVADEWRVLVLDFASPDERVAVVTNGVRYSHLPDGWTGGYAALDTFLVDGPAALAKARSCLDE